MLEEIGKLFGPVTLEIVIAVAAIYYGLIALARIRELYSGRGPARSATARKGHLEALKLEAEIAAIRKTAGLVPLFTADLTPPAITRTDPPFTRLAAFLWEKGAFTRVILVAITAIFQLLGWLAVSVLVLAARYWLTRRLQDSQFQLKSIEIQVLVASLLLGGGSLYLGFVAFGQMLRHHLGPTYRGICAIVFALVFATTIVFWVNQSQQLRSQPAGMPEDQ
jgi:hypothetical protein